MRSEIKIAAGCVAAVAVAGLGPPAAWATHPGEPEPECQGKAHGIQGFHFGSVDQAGEATSAVFAGSALCGTRIGLLGTIRAGYSEGYVLTPGDMDTKAGVAVRCANPADGDQTPIRQANGWCQGDDLPSRSYAGGAGTSAITCLAGKYLCQREPRAVTGITYIDDAGAWLGEPNPHCLDRLTVVQCYQGTDSETKTGVINFTIEPCWALPPSSCREAAKNRGIPDLDPMGDRYLLRIYEPDLPLSLRMFGTKMGEPDYNHPGQEPHERDLTVCEFAGKVGTVGCGADPADWVFRNGPAGTYGCSATKPEGSILWVETFGSLPGDPACHPVTWT